jgi:hypothetical protein
LYNLGAPILEPTITLLIREQDLVLTPHFVDILLANLDGNFNINSSNNQHQGTLQAVDILVVFPPHQAVAVSPTQTLTHGQLSTCPLQEIAVVLINNE